MKTKEESPKRKPTGTIHYYVMKSPVGRILLVRNRSGLKLLSFQDGPHPVKPEPSWIKDEQPFREAIKQLQSYFAGTRKEFTLPLKPDGTPFQLLVWKQLQAIPYGKTVSYSSIAKKIGRPETVRAVGAANRRNPLSIVIPCHRVIGKNGFLVGYGGGLPIKEKLLSLEGYNDFHKET